MAVRREDALPILHLSGASCVILLFPMSGMIQF